VGERSGALQRLVGNYKFQRVYAAHQAIADILDTRLGVLPADAVIVPVPTVAAHIRERGYDHTLLVAKALAKRRNLAVSTVLRRRTTTKQRGASRAERQTQACDAFYVADTPPDVAHVIFDDIVTTGATMRYAAQALRNAGVSQVWALAVARQPLD
jgi:ComF family protein